MLGDVFYVSVQIRIQVLLSVLKHYKRISRNRDKAVCFEIGRRNCLRVFQLATLAKQYFERSF